MLPARLKTLRENANLTKHGVAEYLDIHPTTYGKYELGKREPSMKMTVKIAKFYNVSVDYLRGETDEPRPTAAWNESPALADAHKLAEYLIEHEYIKAKAGKNPMKTHMDLFLRLFKLYGEFFELLREFEK